MTEHIDVVFALSLSAILVLIHIKQIRKGH